MKFEVINQTTYETPMEGFSEFSGPVTIKGEQTVKLEDGRIVEQYIYDIDGHITPNGKPFISLKSNIAIPQTA